MVLFIRNPVMIHISNRFLVKNRNFDAQVSIGAIRIAEDTGKQIVKAEINISDPEADTHVHFFILIILDRNGRSEPFMFVARSYGVIRNIMGIGRFRKALV